MKFYLNTDTQEKETCDVRLTTIESLEKLGKAPTTYKATKAPTGKDKLSADDGKIWKDVQAKQEKDKMRRQVDDFSMQQVKTQAE